MQNSWMPTRPTPMISTFGLVALTLTGLGCGNAQPPAKPASSSRSSAPQPAESTLRSSAAPVIERPKAEPKVASQVAVAPDPAKGKAAAAPAQPRKPAKPAAPPAMPQVLMSEKHRKACKVFVGDTLPEMELPDLAGKNRKASTEYGKKLTVICLFGGKLPTEDQELMDLTTEVVDRYGKDQVAVMGVAVGQTSEAAAAHAKKLGVKFPVFVDKDRKAYDAVATDYLPRTYVVDPTGKILWLDMEYSASTRRQINDAIRHVLETKK